jgi:hypothetical protein
MISYAYRHVKGGETNRPEAKIVRLEGELKVANEERTKLAEELKSFRLQREEIATQVLAALEELTNSVVGGSNVFTAVLADGRTAAVPPHHIEGILEAVRHEFKKVEKFSFTEAAEQRAVQSAQESKQWREKYETLAAKRFPIMNEGYPECPSSIPWFVADRYDRQIQRNHGQSLDALALRGGMDPSELYFAVQSKQYDHNEPGLVEKSVALVKKFNGLDIEWFKLYEELLAHHREAHPECAF